MTENAPSINDLTSRYKHHIGQINTPNIERLIQKEAEKLKSLDSIQPIPSTKPSKSFWRWFSSSHTNDNDASLSTRGVNSRSKLENHRIEQYGTQIKPVQSPKVTFYSTMRKVYHKFFTFYGPIVYTLDLLRLTLPWPVYCLLRRTIDRFFELFTAIGFWIGLDERRLMGDWKDFSLYQPMTSGDWTAQRYHYATQAPYATGFNQWSNLSGAYANPMSSNQYYGDSYGNFY